LFRMKEHRGLEGETGSRMSGRALKNHQAKEETMSLNRKAMVLAVGAALAAPGAHAQITSQSGVGWEFYGKFYPEIVRIHGDSPSPVGTTLSTLSSANITSGATAGNSNIVNRAEMQVGNTYVGFRGGKSLGGGMKGIWQMEATITLDEGGGTLAGRDTFLGVEAGWGTLRLGLMDTPFKKAGDVLGFLGVSSGNFVATNSVLRQVGFSSAAAGPNRASRFHERRGNAIDFASPTFFGGLQYQMQYSIGNPSETAITSNPPRSPRFVSQALKYETGPWYFAIMNEVHFDMFGGSSNATAAQSNAADGSVTSKDMSNHAAVVFKLGVHSFEVDYNMKTYKETPESSLANAIGKSQEYKNTAYLLAMENRWSSQWRTSFHYNHANAGDCKLFNAACSTTGLDGTQISAGVAYYLDPAMYVFGLYSVLKNGDSARYTNGSQAPGVGEDVTQYAIGLALNL